MELPDVPPLKTLAGHGAVLGNSDPSGSMLPDFGSAGQADARFALPALRRLGLLAKLPVLSPPRIHRLLIEGDTDGTYARWSRQRGGKDSAAADHAWTVTRAVAAAAARAGWSRTDFIRVMLDGPYKAGAHARLMERRRERARAAKWLSRAWEGARLDRLSRKRAGHSKRKPITVAQWKESSIANTVGGGGSSSRSAPLAKLIVNEYNDGLTDTSEHLLHPGRPDKD
ncbi:hypothetical protein HUT11_14990 [Streptomyces seoulensis]|nr:hypothetical protein HUT11_14990 [Streptomyces seoulensis]